MKQLSKVLIVSVLCSLMVGGTAGAQKAVYVSGDSEQVGARITYDYLTDSMFHVNTKVGYVTDIEMKAGERITYIAGGDTARWLIDKATVSNTEHVYIKPMEKNITTNIIINTNLHSYRLEVTSCDSYDPLITFKFEDRNSGNGIVIPGRKKSDFRVSAQNLNYQYRIKAKTKADISLMPSEIFDDGTKTYIRIPKSNKYDLPVIYNIDPWDSNTLSMVNYRSQGDYFIVDRVMEHGRLFYHQKFYVDFFNEAIEKVKAKEFPANRGHRGMLGRLREALEEEAEDIRYDIADIIGDDSEDRKNSYRVNENMAPADPQYNKEEMSEKERIQHEAELRREAERAEDIRQAREAKLQEKQRLAEQRAMKKEAERQAKLQKEAEQRRQAELRKAQLQREQALEAQRAREAEQARLQAEARQQEESRLRQMEAERRKLEAERIKREEAQKREDARIVAEAQRLQAERERLAQLEAHKREQDEARKMLQMAKDMERIRKVAMQEEKRKDAQIRSEAYEAQRPIREAEQAKENSIVEAQRARHAAKLASMEERGE